MVDKVCPLKLEKPGKGTELDIYPTEIDPAEDYAAAKGFSLEGSDDFLMDKSVDNQFQFTDTTNGTKKVSDLLDADQEVYDPTGTDLTSTTTGDAIDELAGRNFGKDFEESTDNTTQAVSGSTFVVRDTVNFTANGAGTNKYRLCANWTYSHNAASNDSRFQIFVDGVQVGPEVREEPKDAGGDQRFVRYLVYYEVNLADGAHTFDLRFRPATASRITTIYYSNLEVWRVG